MSECEGHAELTPGCTECALEKALSERDRAEHAMGRLLTRAEKAEVEVRRLNDKVAVLEQKLDTMAAHLSNARAEVESWRDQCDSIELLRKVYETANATVERYAAAIARAREALKRGRSVRYDTTGGPCSLTEAFNAGVDAALAPVNEALKEVS